ncbi:MAG: hypothetical protein IID46_08645 [Planctomycetes bacterium]|nr:hypothetical protein [Planctomycetota bacterium]
MFDPHPDLTESVIFGLGAFYLLLFAMNACWTFRSYRQGAHTRIRLLGLLGEGQEIPRATSWAIYSVVLLMVSMAHLTGYKSPEDFVIRLPEWFKDFVDLNFSNPVSYFGLVVVGFVLMIVLRRQFVKPTVAWVLLNLSLLFLALSMTDYDFRQIVGKPDNVPIVSMLFIVAFFTWLYFKRAVDNDQRIAEGRPLYEQENNEKVLVWPDLVYTELICMLVITVVLVAWGIVLEAPLEEPSNSAKTPNPSKAPWYFLGLQEMLVYYDPWLAGVVFPSLILVGLMAIPYIDFNKKGCGYFTFNERKFAVVTFMFGFMPMWISMIVLGTFLRGPNWNFFGIYEYWDVHKLEVLENVYVSDLFWIDFLGRSLPVAPAGASEIEQAGYILLRESPGFAVLIFYFLFLPPLMTINKTMRTFFYRMGFIRYMVFSNLLLSMAILPIKMVLRWSFNLKYFVRIEEWLFNI